MFIPFFAYKLKLSGYNNLATHCNFQNIVIIIIVLSTLSERTSLKKALLGLDIIQKQHHEIFLDQCGVIQFTGQHSCQYVEWFQRKVRVANR